MSGVSKKNHRISSALGAVFQRLSTVTKFSECNHVLLEIPDVQLKTSVSQFSGRAGGFVGMILKSQPQHFKP